MKSNIRLLHPATFFFLLTVVVVLVSWVVSMQGVSEVQNLLTADALRWQLRHVLPHYITTPALGVVMILFMGAGLLFHSGWVTTLCKLFTVSSRVTRKEKIGLFFSLLVGTIYALFLFSITYAPLTLLRSVTGALQNSPFLEGIYYLISVGMGLMGIVFGYTSGRMHSDRDIVAGMRLLFIRCADYFVILFFLAHFFLTLQQSALASLLAIDYKVIESVFVVLSYLLLLPSLWKKSFFQ